MARPETRSKILISMKLAGREFGVLDVESDQENAFGVEDRVMLENAANLCGPFLGGVRAFHCAKSPYPGRLGIQPGCREIKLAEDGGPACPVLSIPSWGTEFLRFLLDSASTPSPRGALPCWFDRRRSAA